MGLDAIRTSPPSAGAFSQLHNPGTEPLADETQCTLPDIGVQDSPTPMGRGELVQVRVKARSKR